jgi:aminopeptidase N
VGLFVLIATLLIAAPADAQRLPDAVVPEHYSLWFAPDLDKEAFRGRQTIDVVVTQPTTTVTMNAAELQFGEVTITSGGRTQVATVSVDAAGERVTFTVPNRLSEGNATIDITYSGVLNDKLRGFYISKANGRKYAVTQMEPTDARRAFPSFDEPSFKATFDISMMVDAGDTAISNGRVLSDSPGPEPGKHTITYARTPKMSTYLVAMIVGDFVCAERPVDAVTIRVCSTPDKKDLTGYALDVAQHQLKFYNEYFGIPYVGDKLDLIAVPDFAAGAMENWGAITFRDRLLLIDPERSSVNVRKNVASIISHEIAHQWFGNLVTMKWWDDIWLNEGFATWIAAKPLAEWRPDWKVELDEVEDSIGALGIDALRTTRAIRTKVETPDEINEVFDGIAYEKTAAVLRMIEAYVGPEAFRRAIAAYLKKYAYRNAAGEDFWAEVTRVTGRPVDRILRSYVDQPGAPVLSIRNRCDGNSTQTSLEQERFFGTPGASASAPQRWTLPVCSSNANGAPRCEVVSRESQTMRTPGCGQLFANADARGYYFSEYAPDAVRAFAKNPGALDPAERLSLLGDEWWMVRGGRHDIDVFLDLAAALSTDDTPSVVENIAARLGTTAAAIADPAQLPAFQRWIRERFTPALSALGLPGDMADPDERQLRRATLLTLTGVTGNDADVQRRARELVDVYMKDPRSLPPSLVPALLQVAAVGGDRVLYDRYVAQLDTLAANPEEYYRYFNALPAFSDPALVKRTLEFALTPAVRTQDTATLIGGLLARPSSRDAAWEFTRTQWATIVQKLGTFQGIPGILSALGNFCSTDRATEIRGFFKANPVPSAERTLQQALERVENCAALDARQSPAFATWLAGR